MADHGEPLVVSVDPGSPASGRVRPGERLLKVNGHTITDVFDYKYYTASSRLALTLRTKTGALRTLLLRKGKYDDLGLNFETYLMDRQQHCKNKCVFCFIDQLPKGLRESLYFKDDDARLSFLHGNYITLTNLSDADVERICTMHISPINVSVHTTNPELRVRMMKNPAAARIMERLRRFAAADISMNGQVVLCRHWNDGEELTRTLTELAALYPAMQSVSVVPIGLTKHREGLEKMEPFDRESARKVIAQVEKIAADNLKKLGTRMVYLGDEWYLKAGLPIPPVENYEDFPQIENGVGMLALFEEGFREALDRGLAEELAAEVSLPRHVTMATGFAAAPFFDRLVKEVEQRVNGFSCTVIPVENRFFGPEITVAGLLTGQDIVHACKGKAEGTLLLPACTLRAEGDLFLDDYTPERVEREVGVPLRFTENEGEEFLRALFGQ